MQHPEFDGRLKPGIARGQTQDDWDIDWLFPRVDPNEYFWVSDDEGRLFRQRYEFNYIDPDTPNSNGGIHPAYSDFRLRATDGWGELTPHGTRVSGFIIGDTLGQAQTCRYTMVKMPQYTNGPRSESGILFPLFSVKDALNMIRQDIGERKNQGEELFEISSSMGYIFGSDGGANPLREERRFERFWQDFLNWVNANGITIVGSAGNSRYYDSSISLIPARLFRNPNIVVGSVTPNAMPHPHSQGNIGDGILTAYAPSAGALVPSSDPDGDYVYQWLNPALSPVTSYGTY